MFIFKEVVLVNSRYERAFPSSLEYVQEANYVNSGLAADADGLKRRAGISKAVLDGDRIYSSLSYSFQRAADRVVASFKVVTSVCF